MSGWAIPEEKAGAIIQELVAIRDEFLREKEAFLADYDESVIDKINAAVAEKEKGSAKGGGNAAPDQNAADDFGFFDYRFFDLTLNFIFF